MRALLIDDDPLMLRLLTRQLGDLGISAVTTSECPVSALAVMTDDPAAFDLLILDLNMPRMDGIEMLREIAWLGFAGAVVLLSGEDERILAAAESLAGAENLRVAGRLRKPVSREDLGRVLQCVPTREDRAVATVMPERLFRVDELEQAIHSSQLVNHYQPQVSFSSGRVTGVEALVRWQHPEEGLVMPHRFIPLAEKGGLISELSSAVLATALADASEWLAAGVYLRISLNASMEELQSLDYPDRLVAAARRVGFPVDHLVVEVTESQLSNDWPSTLDVAARLRLKGIGLAVDDYGTGYSSLSQLRDLPFDELKLDRSFISGIGNSESLRAIIGPHLEMSHKMGLTVVAEGVEERADWDYLREAGCDIAQGYFVARPMHPRDLVPWLADWDATAGTLAESRV